MTAIPKIALLFVIVQWIEVNGDPFFQGLSFQRGFEINFKPLERKPFKFLKEKWSPFGVFGKKIEIHKRSLDDMVPQPPLRVPRPAAPVFEHFDEIEHIGTGPLLILPKPVTKPPVSSVPIIISTPKPAVVIQISSVKPPPLPVPMPIIVNELPPLPEKPHAVPPISSNMVIIHPKKITKVPVPPKALYTDISNEESVKEFIHTKPPPPPVEVKPPVPVPEVPKPPPPPEVPPPPPVKLVVPPPVSPVPPPPVSPVPPPPEAAKAAEKVVVKEVELVEEVKEEKEVTELKEKKEIKEEMFHHHPIIPKTDIHLKDNALIKGSKMALQFGTVFLSLMAQFFDSARATIDQMTNPPPIYKE
ncbi:uncharacterized protein LOC142980283 [Anticarsia gemmatalis]|uniref:uncharacterized protein LOC142980283 n=1 Tax=Anticarsia gemmatalis TaxID=129554 RepID=UPI003F75F519